MKKILMLICAMMLVFGAVGSANALSFKEKKFVINQWFNKEHKIQTWDLDIDALFNIDPWEKVNNPSFTFKFEGEESEEVETWKSLKNHMLSLTIKRKEGFGDGEFKLKWFKLKVGWEDKLPPNPVPEPATILLMGTGLLGLVAYSRKRFSKKS